MVSEALGHYRIIEKIGTGGMGEVYRALDDRLDREIALKVLPAGTVADEVAQKRFHQEALILAKLNHPNIATIHEFGSHEGIAFLVMELISGSSLKEILSRGPLAEKQILHLGLQLADGLAAAHQHGVVHRDLKPGNIMVTTDDRLKILDFGLAKLVEDACADVTETSSKGDAVPGTLPYMAPEQVKGEPVDERADIYGAGAVLYEMATGQGPFPETNAARLLDCILHKTPQPPCELNQQLSPRMQAIILKALEKSPEDRQHSIHELSVELETLSSTASVARPFVAPEQTQVTPVEIAHVLFGDLVRYSALPMEEQRRRFCELLKIAQNTTEYVHAKSADQRISLSTGDGMALVFFGDPEAPLRCAVEISRAIAARPEIELRMGIHSGPVYRVRDINGNINVVGGGINFAQRVMDSGDAGHILVSKTVVDVLSQLQHWTSAFHDLGEVEVKRGHMHLYNFYTDDVGNPKPPYKSKTAKPTHKTRPQREGGTSRRQRRARPISGDVQPPPITVPKASRWTLLSSLKARGWTFRLSLAACVLVLGATTLSVRAVRNFFSLRPAAPAGIPSREEGEHVIVLPFDVQGDRDTLGYVAEGLDEELSRKLSALPRLHVVSASAAEQQAKHQNIDLKGPAVTIGRNFGVNLIVHGTVQEGGGWTRINVDFDDVAANRRLLTKAFSYPSAAIKLLDLEDQLHQSIVSVLKLRPSNQERKQAANPTGNNDAYEHYLQGRHALSRQTNTRGINTSIGFYERAIQEDPGFALAYVRLSDACRAMYKETNEPSWVHKALKSAQKAQELNDDLPEVHLALGDTFLQLGETKEAVAEFDRAKKLSPNSDLPWLRLGRTYEDAGQRDQSIDAYMKATQLDPYSLADRNELGSAYFNFGEYENALAQFRRVTDLDPDNYWGYMNSGAVYLAKGRYQDSLRESQTALGIARDHGGVTAGIHTNLGTAYYYLRRYADSVKENEQAVKISPKDYVLVGNLADAYRWSGRKKEATETYKTAIDLVSRQLEINPRDTDALGSLALYYAKNGDLLRAEDCIRRGRLIDPAKSDLIFYQSTVRMIAKQGPQAMESLRLALEKGYSSELVRVDPEFSGLRSNPDFEKLLKEYSEKSN
jgi:serine/threonine protein kinase/tetratricopeptide (TPR) repeat protein